jgi:cell division septation protein DedD
MTDEGFHEIQLNGKQLVFLFMTATVVAVVIFLCGVMVGRGVRVQQGGQLAAAALDAADPTAATQPPTAAAAGGPGDGAPISTQETLTYTGRLEGNEPPVETFRDGASPTTDPTRLPEPPAEEPAPVRSAPARPVPERGAPARPSAAASAPLTAAPSSSPAEPAGAGFVVQVAAVTERGEADTIARRLSTKGYPAFVTTPAGAARVFRVRVGKYKERREAETVASRLAKEEQFKPWITR